MRRTDGAQKTFLGLVVVALLMAMAGGAASAQVPYTIASGQVTLGDPPVVAGEGVPIDGTCGVLQASTTTDADGDYRLQFPGVCSDYVYLYVYGVEDDRSPYNQWVGVRTINLYADVVLYDLDVNVVGQGTVDVDPDTPQYVDGTDVELTANAASGWSFIGWSGDLTGATNPDTINMDGDKVVTATFAPTQDLYTLEVNVVGQGAVTKDPDQATYVPGAEVLLTGIADPGWTFAGWTGDVVSTTNPYTVTMDGSKVVTATFTEDEYTLEVNLVGQGAVTKDPDQATYLFGDVVTLTATADLGWTFAGWSGDVVTVTNPYMLLMDASKVVTATFTQDEYTLTVNVVGNGAVTKDPDQATYLYGDGVTLTALADAGWTFAGWTGDLTGDTNPDTITMDGNKVVTATFTKDEYTLDVDVVGQGAVTKDPDQGTYAYGDVVTLTAVADPDWMFTGWSGDLTGDTNPDTVTMDGNKVVTATFEEIPPDEYTLTVNVVGDGAVTKDPDQATYVEGTVVTLTAVADPDWEFAGWSGDLAGDTNPDAITMDENKVVTATFEEIPPEEYTLTVYVVGSGVVTKDPSQATYTEGTVVTLTAVANIGWGFVGWSGDLTGDTNPDAITMDGNKVVTATFEQVPRNTLTVNVVGGGTVTKDPDETLYVDGAVVTLTAVADTGWFFTGWSGDLTGDTNPDTITMDGDKVVTATFESYLLFMPIVAQNYTPD